MSDASVPSARQLADDIEARRRAVGDPARADATERQHSLGKLTARERVDLLFDEDTFVEAGRLVTAEVINEFTEGLDAPADGIIIGTGDIEDRPVGVTAFDFTVLGGSHGVAGDRKLKRQTHLCIEHGYPSVMLLDGGGHRIQEGLDARHFAEGNDFWHLQSKLSGWVPLVACLMGPGFAGPTNFAALADLVVIVEGTAQMGIAGPALVKASTGEDLTKEELGGARVQADQHGMADLVADSDAHAIELIREYLSYFPSNCGEPPPWEPTVEPDRDAATLTDVVPANTRMAYDVRQVIQAVVDGGSSFELKPGYAPNVVTSLARIGGRPIGIVANQPQFLAGALDSAACEKAAHFISLCDAFGLALVFLIDVPGFMVGSQAEQTGLARRSGKMLFELGRATVPRISVTLRKGYGLAYLAMCGGRSFDADASYAWPTAELSAMSIPGAVDVVYRRQIASSPDPEAERQGLIDTFNARVGSAWGASGFGIDDVILPGETRDRLHAVLARAPVRRPSGDPPRIHPVTPI